MAAEPTPIDPPADPAPADLEAPGRALWASVADEYELAEHERSLLHEASRVADRLAALDAVVRAEGVTVTSPQGVKAHPALVESRQQEVTLTRLIASLRLPSDEGERPQRRGGARGAYAARRAYGTLSTGDHR